MATGLAMEPLISMGLVHVPNPERIYPPGGKLEFEYQLDAIEAADLQAVEASVLWYTEGKGDEDIGVHYFERREPADAEEGDLRPLRRLSIELPVSPLSYNGILVKIRWCTRVRIFTTDGRDTYFDQGFQLGHVPDAIWIDQPEDSRLRVYRADPSEEPTNAED